MRTIRRARKFKSDLKKIVPTLSDRDLKRLKAAIGNLQAGKKLDTKLRDHALIGDWKGYRDLHIKPDLVLIYKVTKKELLLARLNSHAVLFKK